MTETIQQKQAKEREIEQLLISIYELKARLLFEETRLQLCKDALKSINNYLQV